MNIYIHKDIVLTSVVHSGILLPFATVYLLVCIKFLQMIVIFPESPQTFTWGGSQSLLFIFRSFAFCMTKRLFLASKVSEDKRKWNLPPVRKRPSFIRRTSKPTFTQGQFRKIAKNRKHKLPPEHTFIWRLAY